MSTFTPDWASPPGDTIRDLLSARAMTQLQLADGLALPVAQVPQLLDGTHPITEEIARRLQQVLGATSNFWLQRESQYRAAVMHQTSQAAAPACPNAEAILAYAARIGVKNAELVYEGLFGWSLKGDGREHHAGSTRPLVWKVCYDCGMACGGGSSNKIQINPSNFKQP